MDLEHEKLTVEWVAIERLFGSPANPRHNDEAVPHVVSSLRRFGWQQPIVAKPSGEVIAGNTRLKAAQHMELKEVPVAWFSGSGTDATAYQIADDRTHEFADWNDGELAQILEQLRSEDALEGVGFDDAEIDELLASLVDAPGVDDPGPGAIPSVPVTRTGDLWILGEHRLLCGDSTVAGSYKTLLDGELADLVWTDPPYGVSYVGGTDDALTIENDELTGDDLQSFLESALRLTAGACWPGAVWYVAAPAGPNFLPFANVLTDLGVWRQTLVWAKDSLVLGRSDYHYRHESIFYGWVPGAAHQPPPTRDQDTIWEIARPKSSPDHPTTKPMELVTRAIENSTRRGGVILDPFCGSGTTLLAAEATRRLGRGIELDPRYCDVVIRRWETASGERAVLDGTKRTFDEVEVERMEESSDD